MTGVGHRREQDPGLLRRARPQLDQRVSAESGDVGRVGDEDLPLTPRRVVLVKARDLVEQVGAPLVIEVLRWELFGDRRQPARHIRTQRSIEIGTGEEGVDAHRSHYASLAQRKPEKTWRLMG